MTIQINDRLLGSHIKSARKRLRLTQAVAAERIGVSTGYYASLERGDTRINLDRLFAICIVMRISPASILDKCCYELTQMELSLLDEPEDKRKLKLLIEKSTPPVLKSMYAVCEALFAEYEKI